MEDKDIKNKENNLINNPAENIEGNLKYYFGNKVDVIYNFGREIYFETGYENLPEIIEKLKNSEDFNFNILSSIKYKQINNFLLICLFSFENSLTVNIRVKNPVSYVKFDIKNLVFSLKKIFETSEFFINRDYIKDVNNDVIIYSQFPETLDTFDIYLSLNDNLIKDAYLSDEITLNNKSIIIKNREINKLISVLSKLDYKAGIFPELCFCMGIENLLQIKLPKRAAYIRMLLSEIFRINCHLSYIVNMGLVLENSSIFNYALVEKEKLSQIIELITGSRVIPNFIRIGGVKKDVEESTMIFINKAIPQLYKNINKIEDIFSTDAILLEKLINSGIADSKSVRELGVTGPNLRASAVRYDLRKAPDYLLYRDIAFTIPLGKTGDNFDRVMIRFKEIYQSLKIIREIIHLIPLGVVGQMINPANLEFYPSRIISTVESVHGVYKLFIDIRENNNIEVIPINPIKNSMILCENTLRNCKLDELLPIVSSFGIDSAEMY